MANKPIITQELLRQLLDYDPETGMLTWKPRSGDKKWTTRWAGKPALNHLDTNGYLYGRIFWRRQYAHRIAWIHFHGSQPDDIDHINGNRADNRIENLRSVTRSQNLRNCRMNRKNTSGVVGVFKTRWGSWKADICQKTIGSFKTREEAIAARKDAERRMGFTERHGTKD